MKCGNSAKKFSSNSTSTSSTRTSSTISSSKSEESIDYHQPKFRRGNPEYADNLAIWKMTRCVNFKAHGGQIFHNPKSSPRLYSTKKLVKLQRQTHVWSKKADFSKESIGERTESYIKDDNKRFINGQPKIFQGIMLKKRMDTLSYATAEKDDECFTFSFSDTVLEDIEYNCSFIDQDGTKLDVNRMEDYIELYKFYTGNTPNSINSPWHGGTNAGRFWKNAREFRSAHPNHPKREDKEAQFVLVADRPYPIPNRSYSLLNSVVPGSAAEVDDDTETLVPEEESSSTEEVTIKTVTETFQTNTDLDLVIITVKDTQSGKVLGETIELNKNSLDTTDSEDSCVEILDPPSELDVSTDWSQDSTPDAVYHEGEKAPKQVIINITPQEEVDCWSDDEIEGYSYLPYATELPKSEDEDEELTSSKSLEHVLTGISYAVGANDQQTTPKQKPRSSQQTRLLIKKIESVAITGQLYNSHEIEVLKEALDKQIEQTLKWRNRAERKSLVVSDMSCKLSGIHDTLSNVLKARGLCPLDFFVNTGDSDHPHVKNGQHIHVSQIDFTQDRACPANPPCEMKNTTMCINCEMLFTNSAIMAMILAVFSDNEHSIKRFIPGSNYGFGETLSGELELTQVPFPNKRPLHPTKSMGNLAKSCKLDDSLTVMFSPDDIGMLGASQSTRCNSSIKSVVDTTIDDRTTQDFNQVSIFDSDDEEWFDAE